MVGGASEGVGVAAAAALPLMKHKIYYKGSHYFGKERVVQPRRQCGMEGVYTEFEFVY